jgi:hypothetical protein
MTTIAMTDFASGRHFNPDFAGTKPLGVTPEEFTARCNDLIAEGVPWADGYMPFCKHAFILVEGNFDGTLAGIMPIEGVEDLLRSEYRARREGELAVLTRWFESRDVTVPEAVYLDVVLYDAAQCAKEGIDIGAANFGIVSINSEPLPQESPMPPVTMMRNALGKDQGGSGAPLDPEAYAESVEYWSKFATVK